MTRVVFMGTPEFAVPSLDALLDNGYEVVGAFTQPDRPVGRGHKLAACPVKQRALERGVPVYQFERVRRQEGLDAMRALKPDVVVTAAFGQILSKKLLEVPVHGTVNVHASLLPQYRGSAPINWCILNGETVSGVTTMLTDAGIDTGDMLLSRETPIGDIETAGELTERLSHIGAELLIETLDKYLKGEITPVKQDESKMSHQPMLDKDMGRIDWNRSAKEISCQVRGLNPWPCAFTTLPGGNLKIYLAKPADMDKGDAVPGEVIESSAKKGLFVACGEGVIEIIEMQAPNAKRMAAKVYLNGKKIDAGTVLGKEDE
ncbi:MAG: methionyl-tRNA formyltransferase [Clostridia bacterium]|nr:methionyl-tRNA formyltransferase [Clostridia bacterium]